MEIFGGSEELVHDVTLMNILQERAFLYHSVQVRIWDREEEEETAHLWLQHHHGEMIGSYILMDYTREYL